MVVEHEKSSTQKKEQSRSARLQALDAACLQLCIELLDHRLIRNIFDSIVIGFLAMAGIDQNAKGFLEAPVYTSKLNALSRLPSFL